MAQKKKKKRVSDTFEIPIEELDDYWIVGIDVGERYAAGMTAVRVSGKNKWFVRLLSSPMLSMNLTRDTLRIKGNKNKKRKNNRINTKRIQHRSPPCASISPKTKES